MTSHSIDTTNASFNAMLAARAQDMIDQLARPQTTDVGRSYLKQLASNSDGASVNLAMSGEFNESAASATLDHALPSNGLLKPVFMPDDGQISVQVSDSRQQ